MLCVEWGQTGYDKENEWRTSGTSTISDAFVFSFFFFFFFFFLVHTIINTSRDIRISCEKEKRKEKGNLQRIKRRRGMTYVVISLKPPQNRMYNRTTKWFSHWTVDRKRIMFELFIRVFVFIWRYLTYIQIFVFIWRYLTYIQIRRVIKEVQEYSCNSRYIF